MTHVQLLFFVHRMGSFRNFSSGRGLQSAWRELGARVDWLRLVIRDGFRVGFVSQSRSHSRQSEI